MGFCFSRDGNRTRNGMSSQLSPSSSSSPSSTGGVSLNSNLLEASARCYAAIAASASQQQQQQQNDLIAAVLQSAVNYEKARARAASTNTVTNASASGSGSGTYMLKRTAMNHPNASTGLKQVSFYLSLLKNYLKIDNCMIFDIYLKRCFVLQWKREKIIGHKNKIS